MRVPLLVAIPIVALCATTGLALGWLFPLTPTHHRDGAPTLVATASPTSAGRVREPMELAPEGRITISEDDWASKESASSIKIEESNPTPSDSETAALASEADLETSTARPQNKTSVPKANPPKSAKKPGRLSAKEAQRPANLRARLERDDNPAREKQPTRSIISQLPIFGPVFGLLVP